MKLPVSMIKAGGCEEEGFVRHKRIDADMMRCLQSRTDIPPFRLGQKSCEAAGRGATLVGRKYTAHALHLANP